MTKDALNSQPLKADSETYTLIVLSFFWEVGENQLYYFRSRSCRDTLFRPTCRMTRQRAAAINDSRGATSSSSASSASSASGLAARLLSGMNPAEPDIVVTADNFSPAGE